MNRTDSYIDSIENLPPAPSVATELLVLFKNETGNSERIVELITYDPSLTVQVLRRCNSAFFRGREKVADVASAVARLGFYEIYCIVVSMISSRTMALAEEGGAIDAGSLWRHSVISAVAAGTLAKRVGLNEAECFTAGLLHDVGKLIFASAEPVIYESIVGHVGSHGAMLIEMERSELGMTHAAVGARLLERWGLPVNVQKGVRYHHRPAHAPAQFKKIAAAMEVANVVAHQVDSENDLTPTLAPGTMQAMHVLGLNPEQFADVIRETESGLKRMEELLNLVKPKTDPHGFPALVS